MAKILFLGSGPEDQPEVGATREFEEIRSSLLAPHFGRHFELKASFNVSASGLSSLLMEEQPNIVHFCGHGSEAGELVFFDTTTPIEFVAGTFGVLAEGIRCVVLSACYSAAQARQIASHIDVVVGLEAQIEAEAALSFVAKFYEALGYAQSIAKAFELGCLELQRHGLQDGDGAVMELRAGVNPNEIFVHAPRRSPPHSNASGEWHVVLNGKIVPLGGDEHDRLLRDLRTLTGDSTLTIVRLQTGSLLIDLDGELHGYLRFRSLFEHGQLTHVQGREIRSVGLGTRRLATRQTMARASTPDIGGGALASGDSSHTQAPPARAPVWPSLSAGERDRKWLRAWCAGDPRGGDRLTIAHFELVRRYFYRRAPDEYEDLMQGTFLAFAKSRDDYCDWEEVGEEELQRTASRASVRSFLLGIARTVYLDYLNELLKNESSDPHKDSVYQLFGYYPSSVLAARREERTLLDALQELPINLQDLVEFYYWEELPTAELAAMFEMSENAVTAYLARARGQLRERLAERGMIRTDAQLEQMLSGRSPPPYRSEAS